MAEEKYSVILNYELLESDKMITFQASPLLGFRNFHGLAGENESVQVKMFGDTGKEWRIEPYQMMPPLVFKTSRKIDFFRSSLKQSKIPEKKEVTTLKKTFSAQVCLKKMKKVIS